MRKICVVTGNRAEYSRLKSVMQAIIAHPELELVLIVTGTHLLDDFGKSIRVIEADGFKVDSVASTIVAGEDLVAMAKSAGLCALELPTLLEHHKPDVVLIIADCPDVLGVATAATFMNIPLASMQGGEITGAVDESIRHAITKLSHIHFPATEKSAERIRKMGERPDLVFNVGCSSVDIISSVDPGPREKICKEYEMDPAKPFLIMAQHPVTTEYGEVRKQIRETLEAMEELKIQAIMLYPNVDAGSKDMVREIRLHDEAGKIGHFNKLKNVPVEDFIKLLWHAACIVGNSSAGIREACYLGTPAINIGTRQSGRERGKNVVDIGHDKEQIKRAVESCIRHGKYKPEHVYGEGNSGKKIADILAKISLDNIIQKRLLL